MGLFRKKTFFESMGDEDSGAEELSVVPSPITMSPEEYGDFRRVEDDKDRFNAAVDIIFENEGGSKLTDDPNDLGGLTKFGISRKNNPDIDVANLTYAEAAKIAKERYWDKFKINMIKNDSVATHLYDMVFAQGYNGVKALQEAVKETGINIVVDGGMGKDTAKAVEEAIEKVGENKFHHLIAENRIKQFEKSESWEEYHKGWTNRTFKMLDLFTKRKK